MQSSTPRAARRRSLVRLWLALLATLALALPPRARAQTAEDGWAPPVAEGDRPTSGDASLLSGRTLGSGEVLLAAALGWPGFWAHVELAPSSTLNVGIRAAVLYGSPAMGIRVGAGGEVSVPIRIRLWGEGDTDLALRVTPRAAFGEGVLFGETTTFGGELGWMARLDAEAVIGVHPDPRVTFVFGLGVGGGLSHVPAAASPEGLGRIEATVGVEGLLARDTMLFAEVKAGYGLAREPNGRPFYGAGLADGDRVVLGLALGVAYLL